MELNEITISRAIVATQMELLVDYMEMDVAVVGAGPSGLAAAALLGDKGLKVGVIEKKLSIGGGMWGGGDDVPPDRSPGRSTPAARQVRDPVQEL